MSEPNQQSQIFRKVAMDRLSSPDQLDTLIRIITPKAWLALSAMLLMVFMALLWGIFGQVPSKIKADKCILINPSGLADITSGTSGRITEVLVQVGDLLEVGTPVARVAQPDLLDKIDKTQAHLHELEAQSRITMAMSAQAVNLTHEGAQQQSVLLQGQIRAATERNSNARERGRVARERAVAQQELYRQGLVTQSSVLAIQQEVLAARQEEVSTQLEADNLNHQIEQLKLQKLDRVRQQRGESNSLEAQINEVKRQLDSLQQNLKNAVTIVSSHAGRVTEIKAGSGMLVGNGIPVITLELNNVLPDRLQAALYIPVAEGRKLQPEMEVQLVPSTVRREQFGSVIGRITHVSDYPATPQSMMLLLQNELLVRELAGTAPPIEVRVSLYTDPGSYSGYAWTSRKGPDVKLVSGTLCNSEITIERQRPISLVIPILKNPAGAL